MVVIERVVDVVVVTVSPNSGNPRDPSTRGSGSILHNGCLMCSTTVFMVPQILYLGTEQDGSG